VISSPCTTGCVRTLRSTRMLRSIDLRRQSGLSHQSLGSAVSIGTTFGWHNRYTQRYVLEGSVRKAGDRVRISAQLIDSGSGAHLWADRFDGSLVEIFELQDRVASSVAGATEPALQRAEAARSFGRPTADLTAYDLYLRAHAMIWSSARQISEALPLLEQAIARDPYYGPALAWAAYCCF